MNGLVESNIRHDDSFLSSQQPSLKDLRSEPEVSEMIAEEGRKGEGDCGEDEEVAGASAIAD